MLGEDLNQKQILGLPNETIELLSYNFNFWSVGNKGKIETGVPSYGSGLNSSELSIGLRDSEKIEIETVVVDEKILKAGHHHGSTYYEHIAFLNALKNNLEPEVSLDDGLKAGAIGQAAELSIKEKRVVLLSELI